MIAQFHRISATCPSYSSRFANDLTSRTRPTIDPSFLHHTRSYNRNHNHPLTPLLYPIYHIPLHASFFYLFFYFFSLDNPILQCLFIYFFSFPFFVLLFLIKKDKKQNKAKFFSDNWRICKISFSLLFLFFIMIK